MPKSATKLKCSGDAPWPPGQDGSAARADNPGVPSGAAEREKTGV